MTTDRPATSPPPTSPPTAPPPLPCISCGYDLTGLPFAAKCPECATPITRSRQSQSLACAAPHTIAKIVRGLSWVLVASLALAIIAPILAMWLSDTLPVAASPATSRALAEWSSTLAASIVLLAWLAAAFGLFLFTTPLPAETPRLNARRVVRWTLLLQPVALVLACAASYIPPATTFPLLGLFALFAAQPVATLLHAHALAIALPDRVTARHAEASLVLGPLLVAGLPLAGTLAAMALSDLTNRSFGWLAVSSVLVGLCSAFALSWTLLFRLRRHLARYLAMRQERTR